MDTQQPFPAGRTYFVTGASSGIGRALARQLAEGGARLVLTGRQEAALRAVADDLAPAVVFAMAADLLEPDAPVHLAKACGDRDLRLDGLVLNAGTAPFASVDEMASTLWDQAFALNVRSRFFLCQALLPWLAESAVIVMTTASLSDRPLREASAFGASMEGCRGLARCLAVELAPRGVRVCTVSAGPTKTPIYEGYGMPAEELVGLERALAAETLVGRMGRAEEIAEAIGFVLRNGFVHGADLVVDGGYRLARPEVARP